VQTETICKVMRHDIYSYIALFQAVKVVEGIYPVQYLCYFYDTSGGGIDVDLCLLLIVDSPHGVGRNDK